MQYLFYGLLELYLRMYARYVHDAMEFIAQHTKLVLLNLCQFQNRLFEVLSPLNKSANQRKEYYNTMLCLQKYWCYSYSSWHVQLEMAKKILLNYVLYTDRNIFDDSCYLISVPLKMTVAMCLYL